MPEDIFSVLTSGASFDATRFKKDIKLFHSGAKGSPRPGRLNQFLTTGTSSRADRQPRREEDAPSGDFH
jgi:hypothetical protein